MTVCDNCPLRLFNTKHHNLKGIGNPYFGNVIVVPEVDYDAYKKGYMGFSKQVEIIKEVLYSFTGELDNLYIVPMIRCNTTISCEVNDEIYSKCLQYFKEEVYTYNFKHILLLGDSARRFLHCNIKDYLDTSMISPNKRFYNVNYSPLIKYVNDELFEIFKTYLIKWYNHAVNDYFNYSNVIYI